MVPSNSRIHKCIIPLDITDNEIPIVLLANFTQRTRLPRRNPGPFFDFKFFKDPSFTFFEIGFFMVILGMFTPLFYVQQFAISMGMTPGQAFYLLSVINGSSAFGRIIPGFIADRFGPYLSSVQG